MSRTQEQIAVSGTIIAGSLDPEEHGEPYLSVGLTLEQIRTIPLGATVRLVVESVPAPAPEPAEPMSLDIWVCRHISGPHRYHGHLSDEAAIKDGWRKITVSEIPPGWKLVPPVAGRPLPEGVPQPPDGFDYWGDGKPVVEPDDSNSDDAACLQLSKRWHVGKGGYSLYMATNSGPVGRPKAFRRGTALHAANFGKVGR